MKRKVMLVAVAVILCSLVITGGTLAYFTASGRTTNQVTTGKIAMTLHDEYEKQDNLVPSTTTHHEKKVYVELDNASGDAFVRVKVETYWLDAEGNVLDLPAQNIAPDYLDGWQYLDGYYYYTEPLKAGESTTALFESFRFLPLSETDYQGDLTDNAYKGLTAHIDVKAEAIQAANDAISYDPAWHVIYDESAKKFDKPTALSDGAGNE